MIIIPLAPYNFVPDKILYNGALLSLIEDNRENQD